MEEESIRGILALALAAALVALLALLELETVVQSTVEIILIFIGSLAGYGVATLFFFKKSMLEKTKQFHWNDAQLVRAVTKAEVSDLPDLSHLVLYYSKRGDGPESTHPHIPYYVVNTRTTKAYFVRPELLVLQSRGIIEGSSYDEKELKEYLAASKIELVDGGRYYLRGELD